MSAQITPGTPLPWTLAYGFDLEDGRTPNTYVAPTDPRAIGIKLCTPWIESAWDGDEEAAANARYIVHACNLFPELVEALEAEDEALEAERPFDDIEACCSVPAETELEDDLLYERRLKIRHALRKAREGQS